ncbi:hypothetical protein ACTWP5_18945 [Streptomyces sp. 4N509B]|uniref:hypothetical protein n=1 Tax=Streptomyces sp. 4N509B TaxID=3457413 RepID=UPI003FD5B881
MVCTYSHAGDPVLLLAPPAPGDSDPDGFDVVSAGWTAAARLLTPLGRSTHVRSPASLTYPTDPAAPASVTEPGPREMTRTLRQNARRHRAGPTDLHPGPSATPAAARREPDRFSLVITLLDPQSDWAATVPWTRLLTRNGTLTFITHSNATSERKGRFHSLLTHIAEWGGVDCVDRIALVAAPDQAHPTTADKPRSGPRVHTELMVFARPRPTGTCTTRQAVAR